MRYSLIKSKKGNMGILESVILSLVVIGFLLIVGLSLMDKAKDTQTAGTAAYNASEEVIGAMDDIPGWLPIVVLAFIALVVLGVIYMLRRRG